MTERFERLMLPESVFVSADTCEECGEFINYDLRQDGEGTEAYHVASGKTECWLDEVREVLIFDKEEINDFLTRAAVNVTESLLQWSKYPNSARRDLQVARDRISNAIDLLTKELDK